MGSSGCMLKRSTRLPDPSFEAVAVEPTGMHHEVE